jgi:hypothetical protein
MNVGRSYFSRGKRSFSLANGIPSSQSSLQSWPQNSHLAPKSSWTHSTNFPFHHFITRFPFIHWNAEMHLLLMDSSYWRSSHSDPFIPVDRSSSILMRMAWKLVAESVIVPSPFTILYLRSDINIAKMDIVISMNFPIRMLIFEWELILNHKPVELDQNW